MARTDATTEETDGGNRSPPNDDIETARDRHPVPFGDADDDTAAVVVHAAATPGRMALAADPANARTASTEPVPAAASDLGDGALSGQNPPDGFVDPGYGTSVLTSPETVRLTGSNLVFVNTYSSTVTAAYRTAIIYAENEYQSHFSNSITITASFGFANLGAGFLAQNSFHNTVQAGYTNLRNALSSHATSADDRAAVNSLPSTDPSGGRGFLIAGGMARVLGLPGAGTSANADLDLVLGSGFNWTFDPNNRAIPGTYDAIGAIEHELSEGGFGHVGGLGIQNSTFAPMDLFRYSAPGQRDYTGGRDGLRTFFSVDGSQLLTQFHNSISTSGAFDGQDFGDWDIGGDAFGFGKQGVPGLLSTTDLRVIDILGWTSLGPTSPVSGDDYANSLSDTTHPFGQIAVNASSAGTLETTGDRDWFRVQLTSGANYVINLRGLQTGAGTLEDPYLRVYNSGGTLLAQNDDIVLGTNRDSQLTFTAPSSGTFYVAAGAFDDNYTGTYTVSVGSAAPADDYANSLSDTTHPFGQVAVNGSSGGALEILADRDWFRTQLTAGVAYVVNLQGSETGAGTLQDPLLRVYDGSGTLLAQNDDIVLGINRDSQLTFTAATTGTYYLEAGAFNDNYTGTYRVSVQPAPLDLRFVGTGEFNSNSQGDLIFTSAGNAVLWLKTSAAFTQVSVPNASMGAEWAGFGADDFDHDGKTDLMWTNNSGQVAIWELSDGSLDHFGVPSGRMGAEWHVAGIGDLNGDRNADIFWVSTGGTATVWSMSGSTLGGVGVVAGRMGAEWGVAKLGDFNGDSRKDVLWESAAGDLTIWGMSGSNLASLYTGVGHMGLEWSVAAVADFNRDGTQDLVWVSSANAVQIWNMSSGRIGQIVTPSGREGAEWHLKGAADFTGDGSADLLWLRSDGASHLWAINGTQVVVSTPNSPNAVLLGL